MNFWVATTNQGKLKEFQQLLSPLSLTVYSLNDLSSYFPPEETGETFYENAKIKAKSLYAIKSNDYVVADDSGLEVEGLGGLPGVHSARYAGNKATDAENTAKLLKMLDLRSPQNRVAQFHCSLVLMTPNGEEHHFEGQLKGSISHQQKGHQGFGYDPVFVPNGFEKTLAELDPGEKNKMSHRGKASAEMLTFLKNQFD